jgi:hypothetical protein
VFEPLFTVRVPVANPPPPPPPPIFPPEPPPPITKYSTVPGTGATNADVPVVVKVCILYPPAVVIVPPVDVARGLTARPNLP